MTDLADWVPDDGVVADARRASNGAAPAAAESRSTSTTRIYSAEEDLVACLLCAGLVSFETAEATLATVRAAGVDAISFDRARDAALFAGAAAVIDAGAAPTIHLVEAELERRGTLESVGRGFVRELAAALLVPGQAPALARLVAGHARRRQLERAALRAVERIRDGGDVDEIAVDLSAATAPDLRLVPFELEVLTARELCAQPDPPGSDVLLGPLVVRGYRTIVAAGTGEGKTTLSLAMCRAIVTRAGFLEWTGTGGRVLVIDLEQGKRTVKRRLHEAGLADSDLVDYVRVPDGLALDSDVAQQHAIEQLLRDRRYDAVTIDPAYKAHRGDSLDERAVVDFLRLLDRWRAEYGFALLLPTHTRKKLEPSAKLTIDDVFGSSAFVRGAEVVLGLQRLAAGFSRLYWLKHRDGDDGIETGGHWGLLFDRDAGFRRDPRDTAPPRDLLAEVLAYVHEHPRSTTNDITSGVGAGRGTVQKLLKERDEFTFEPGPNKSRLWIATDRVASLLQYHPGHSEAPRPVSGGPSGGLSLESHHEATRDHGGLDPSRTTEPEDEPDTDPEEVERLAALAAELGL